MVRKKLSRQKLIPIITKPCNTHSLKRIDLPIYRCLDIKRLLSAYNNITLRGHTIVDGIAGERFHIRINMHCVCNIYIYMCITVSFYYTTISLLALGSYEEAHFWSRWTAKGSKRYIRGDRTHSITLFFLSFFPLFSAAVVFRCCCFAKGSHSALPHHHHHRPYFRYLYLLQEMITSLSTNSVNVIETFRL